MPSGEEIYHAGDSLSPSPDVDDAAGIAAWIPKAEAWTERARAWRSAQPTSNDPWSFYIDARLSAVTRMIEAYRADTRPEPVEQTPPVITDTVRGLRAIGGKIEGAGSVVPLLAFTAIIVAGLAVAFAMSR